MDFKNQAITRPQQPDLNFLWSHENRGWYLHYSSKPQLLGQAFQTPKRNLFGPKDVNKANNWGITYGGQIKATPTLPRPVHLAIILKKKTNNRDWNKGKPKILAELQTHRFSELI